MARELHDAEHAQQTQHREYLLQLLILLELAFASERHERQVHVERQHLRAPARRANSEQRSACVHAMCALLLLVLFHRAECKGTRTAQTSMMLSTWRMNWSFFGHDAKRQRNSSVNQAMHTQRHQLQLQSTHSSLHNLLYTRINTLLYCAVQYIKVITQPLTDAHVLHHIEHHVDPVWIALRLCRVGDASVIAQVANLFRLVHVPFWLKLGAQHVAHSGHHNEQHRHHRHHLRHTSRPAPHLRTRMLTVYASRVGAHLEARVHTCAARDVFGCSKRFQTASFARSQHELPKSALSSPSSSSWSSSGSPLPAPASIRDSAAIASNWLSCRFAQQLSIATCNQKTTSYLILWLTVKLHRCKLIVAFASHGASDNVNLIAIQ